MRNRAIRTTTCFVLLASAALALSTASAQCAFSATHDLNVDLEGVTTVRVEAGAGELVLLGHDDVATVRAVGSACASSRGLLEQLRIDVDRTDTTLTLRASSPSMFGLFVYARLDLMIDVPASMAVEIVDGSGDISVRHVASLRLDDASGDAYAAEVGNVSVIADGSGRLTFENVLGNLDVVRDASGDIVAREIGGSVRIGQDGSGEIDVRSVDGDVLIDDDASGGIHLEGVGNDVRIGVDGSGDIRVQTVGGSVVVERDASGDIVIAHVSGDVRVDVAGSGSVRVDDVAGQVQLP